MKLEERKEEIIAMYVEQDLTTVEIADIIGCSNSGVGRLLKKYGIPRTHTPNELRVSEETEDMICERYRSGDTTVEIGNDIGLCDHTVAKILRRNGVEIRNASRRSRIERHDFFHSIDTPEKAYFLGWMISDGSVVTSKTRPDRAKIIAFDIHNRDRKILELFADCIGADSECVRHFEKRDHAYIRFASNEMAKDLEQYGVVSNKSWTTYLPILEKHLMPHLIRGIFDGDGTVTFYDKDGAVRFAFYGSQKICEDIRNYLYAEIGLGLNKVSKSTCYHVWWGGHIQAQKFYEYIYSDCGEYLLERKRLKFLHDKSISQGNTEVTDKIA